MNSNNSQQIQKPLPQKPNIWYKYRALWITIIVLVVVGVVVGAVILVLKYVVHKPSSSGTVTPSPGTCSSGQSLCNGKCCTNSSTLNGKCTCTDSCTTSVCQVNNTSVCCPTGYVCGANEGECCLDDGSGACIQGMVL